MQMGLVFLERRPDRWPTSVSTLGVVDGVVSMVFF
jgi:hypothetical protein